MNRITRSVFLLIVISSPFNPLLTKRAYAAAGQCGAANSTVPAPVEPIAGLCSAGTATIPAISGAYPGTGWSWSCIGSNGGSTAACSVPRQTVDASQTVYVATPANGGNDTWSCGTTASPCATITWAANNIGNYKSGTVDVVVHGGTYAATYVSNSTSRITSGNYIRVYPYRGEAAIIDGTVTDVHGVTDVTGTRTLVMLGSYVEFGGFEVRNLPNNTTSGATMAQLGNYGIGGWNSHHDQIINNTVHDISGGGIAVAGTSPAAGSAPPYPVPAASNSHDHLIQGNTVYNTSLENAPPAMPVNTTPVGGVDVVVSENGVNLDCGPDGMACRAWNPAIMLWWDHNSVVAGNTLRNNYGEGINPVMTDGTLIAGNKISDSYSIDLYLNITQNNIATNNLIYYTGAFDTWPHYAFSGIVLARECYYPSSNPSTSVQGYTCVTAQPPMNNNKISNNIVIGRQFGLRYQDYGAAGGLQNTLIANNSFVNQSLGAINIGVGSPALDSFSGNVTENNIFYGAEALFGSYGTLPSSGISFNKNLWFNNTSWSAPTWVAGSSTNSLFSNPLFIGSSITPGAASDFVPTDYALSAISPAKGTAFTDPQVTVDFSNKSRTAPYSIGAFQ